MYKIVTRSKKNIPKTSIISGLVISLFLITAASLNIVSATTVNNNAASISTITNSSEPTKNILLINSYDQLYVWTSDITTATINKLNASGLKYNLEVENMDSKRINNSAYQQLIFNQYKYKFSKYKYDIVLTSDDDALNFTLKHRNELFPGVPVVFCGAKHLQNNLAILKGQKLITGVNSDSDLEGSLDIGLKLQPNVKNIYFIHDNTTTGKLDGAFIDNLIPKYRDKYKITVYTGSLSINEILNNLRQAPADSIILQIPFLYDDKDNRYLNFSDMPRLIRAATNIPLYGILDFNLGDGIIGGKLTSGKSQGNSMADIAIRVLKGENIDKIPLVLKSPNIYAFDYNELVSHKSVMANIPAGSLIINQPETFYSKYKEYVWIGVAIGIVLMSIIAILGYINYLKQSKIIQHEETQRKLKNNANEKNASLQAEIRKNKKIESELNQKNKDLDDLNKIAVNNSAKIIDLQEKIQELESEKSISSSKL